MLQDETVEISDVDTDDVEDESGIGSSGGDSTN